MAGRVLTGPGSRSSLNKWGVVKGTKADKVCQLISRPEGATMKEIVKAVGTFQYNTVNRLHRWGHNITVEGDIIRMVEVSV